MNDVLLSLMTAAADHSWMSRRSALTAAVTSDEFGAEFGAHSYHRTAAVLCLWSCLPVQQTPAQLTLCPAQRHRDWFNS